MRLRLRRTCETGKRKHLREQKQIDAMPLRLGWNKDGVSASAILDL